MNVSACAAAAHARKINPAAAGSVLQLCSTWVTCTERLAHLQALLLHLHRKAQQLLPADAGRAQRQRAVQPQRRRRVADAARDAERDGRGALRRQALAHTLPCCQLQRMAQRVILVSGSPKLLVGKLRQGLSERFYKDRK